MKQAVHEADIKFEASKKTQQIKALQQENDFQRKNKLLFLFIAVLILLVAIFMVRSFYFKMNYSQQQEAVLRIKKEVTEKDKTLLENKLLQSQMKPHFIFNTLGAIHGIVLQNKTQEAAALIIQFSRLMRKMLENTQKEWIAFEDEIEMLQHYTALQQIRSNHRFTFEFFTNDIDKHLLIPPMLIQPFVENAIEHGFKNLPENKAGQLKIEFYKINDVLLSCTVTDNGTGRKGKVPAVEQDHTSMATQLTQQRLQYYETANPGVGLQIADLFEKEQAAGTRVTILMPYQND
jgi:sensor histidine kinase YesM